MAQQAPPADSLSWKFKSRAGLALTQSSFSRSWAGDEVGTVSWVATWDSEAHKRVAPWALWDNSLQLCDGGIEWFTQSRLAAEKDRTVFKSELRVFKAVTTSESDPVKRRYWPAVDMDWQSTWSNKVTSVLSFDLFWQLRYDKQVDLRGQFKQTTGFGLVWQLI